MRDRSSKRPKDPNQLAKLMVDIASGDQADTLLTADGRNAAAVMLGRRGGLKGGTARALKLSSQERSDIAKKAATTRWERAKKDD
jgi:hypothetical protein